MLLNSILSSYDFTIVVDHRIGTVFAAAMVIMCFTLVFLGGSREKHTEAYVGIQMSGVNAKRTPTKNGESL